MPSLVVAVPELPLTHNGKRSERAARDAVNGDPIVNATALRNPGCLDAIRAAVQAPADAPAAAGPDDEPALRDVAGLWCEVLGVREADPDDDFSDLGGTSRQALSLLRRVRLDLGVDVPVQEFALAPTLRGLAQAVVAARSADVAAVPVLRPGRGRPVFFVPDAWGQLNLYAGLVAALDTDRPVLGLHLPLVDTDGRHKSIDEVAAEALAAVREAQPDGPYSLIGYSFGGLVAFEMAVALRHEGEQVPYLGLLDVRPPEAALSRREIARRRWTARVRSVMTGQAVAAVGRRLRGTRQPDQPLPGDAGRRVPVLPGVRAGVRRVPARPVRRRGDLLPGRGLPPRPGPDPVRPGAGGPGAWTWSTCPATTGTSTTSASACSASGTWPRWPPGSPPRSPDPKGRNGHFCPRGQEAAATGCSSTARSTECRFSSSATSRSGVRRSGPTGTLSEIVSTAALYDAPSASRASRICLDSGSDDRADPDGAALQRHLGDAQRPHRGAEPGDRQQVEHRRRRGAVAVGELVEHGLRLVVVLHRGDLAVGLHAQPLARARSRAAGARRPAGRPAPRAARPARPRR